MLTMSVNSSRSAAASQQTREGIPEVFFTKIFVKSLEATSAVPKGYRIARPDEVALNWKKREEFRYALHETYYGAWVDQIDVNSSGPKGIDENGKFVEIAEMTSGDGNKPLEIYYFKTPDAEESYHYSGIGRALMHFDHRLHDDAAELSVTTAAPDYKAPVAYVALKKSEVPKDIYHRK
jgi:hypothetical protein